GQAGQRAGAEVQHVLCGLLGVVVVAQLDVGVGEEAVNEQVIGGAGVERYGDVEGGGEFVLAEQNDGLGFEAVEVVGRELEGFGEGGIGLGVEGGVGDLAGATGERDGEGVVAVGLVGV